MIDLDRLAAAPVMREPYVWAELRVPFDGPDIDLLPAEFPTEGYRSVEGSDGEKSWRYFAKSLWSR